MLNLKFDEKSLFEAIPKRISIRNYKQEQLKVDDFDYIREKTNYINSLDLGVKAYLVNQVREDIFKNIMGSYGLIKNAPSYIMLVGDTTKANIDGLIGYLGEYLVLECESRDIGTCWVAGTFSKSKLSSEVVIKDNEKSYCVVSVGYKDESKSDFTKKAMKSYKRKNLEKLVENYDEFEKSPEWINRSIKYARLAPSAINRQPWKFKVYDNGVDIVIDKGLINTYKIEEGKKLDLGIALFHVVVTLKNYYKEVSVEFDKEVFAKVRI